MENWCAEDDCGTVACIGGTAEMVGDVSFSKYTLELMKLFFPNRWLLLTMSTITVEQAAQALRNYLTTGTPDWESIL